MQITIKQEELELALREYIAKLGIGRPIHSINFTATRGQGNNKILTEVELNDITASDIAAPVAPPGPIARPEPSRPRAVEAPVKDVPFPAEPPAKAEAAEGAAEPEDDNEEEAETPAGKSLFG